MICQKCGLTEATVHRQSVVFRQTIEEHLCVLCAGGLEGSGVMESVGGKWALTNPGLPWRLAGESVDEEHEARFDAEGRKLLRSLLARLLEKTGREVSLNISFGQFPQLSFLSLLAINPQAIHVRLFNSQLEADVRNRGDIFFRSLGDIRWSPHALGWKWEMSPEGEAIAATCLRLFSEVFSLTPKDVLKFNLSEWFEIPPGGKT